MHSNANDFLLARPHIVVKSVTLPVFKHGEIIDLTDAAVVRNSVRDYSPPAADDRGISTSPEYFIESEHEGVYFLVMGALNNLTICILAK